MRSIHAFLEASVFENEEIKNISKDTATGYVAGRLIDKYAPKTMITLSKAPGAVAQQRLKYQAGQVLGKIANFGGRIGGGVGAAAAIMASKDTNQSPEQKIMDAQSRAREGQQGYNFAKSVQTPISQKRY